MRHYENIVRCRICGSEELTEVINLAPQYISSTFVESNEGDEISKIKVPLTILLCDKSKNKNACGLVQLKETVNPSLLYTNYFYRSAVSDTMRRDLRRVVDKAQERCLLDNRGIVVDIGANDCTMLGFFPSRARRIAVEPAKNINWKEVDKSITVVNDYFSGKVLAPALNGDKVKIFTCCAMFYDLDNPNSFVADINSLLAEDGIWCIQLSYVLAMLKNMNFYDICHEHLEYYSLQTLSDLMKRHGLEIFDAEENNVNGGSLLVFIAHKGSGRRKTENLKRLLQAEEEMKLDDALTYRNFYGQMKDLAIRVRGYIERHIKAGRKVIGLGASTKGNVLLQFFGIDKEMLPVISERNPMKVGLRTMGSDIKLISEEEARRAKPASMLVLPWYFRKEIIEREKEYIDAGGTLLFPMPRAEVVSKHGVESL